MDELSVTISASSLIVFVIGLLIGLVGGYFLGREVQRRREEGISTRDALDMTRDKVIAALEQKYQAGIAQAKAAAEQLNKQ